MPTYQFDQFHFDTTTGALTTPETERVLRPKTAVLLTCMIQHRNRMLSKDELLETIWGETVVSENTLMQGIQELRKLLGDKARNPRFIRTYSRRGYQWIFAPIHEQGPLAKPDVPVTPQAPAQDETPEPVKSQLPWRLPAILATAIILVLAWTMWPEPEKQETDNKLAVLPFANATGDPALKWLELGLSDMLTEELAQLLPNKVVPSLEVYRVWAALPEQREPVQVADRLKISHAVAVTVNRQDKQFSFDWTLHTPDGQEQHHLSAAMPETIVPRLALALARAIDKQADTPYRPQAASKAMAAGHRAMRTSGAAVAYPFFREALDTFPADPTARAFLAQSLDLQGRWQEATVQYDQALATARESGNVPLQHFILENLITIALHRMELDRAGTLLADLPDETRFGYLRGWRAAMKAAPDPSIRITPTQYKDAQRLRAFPSPGSFSGNAEQLRLALAYYRESGDLANQAVILLAMSADISHGLDEKEGLLQEALDLFVRTGHQRGVARTLTDMCYLHLSRFEEERMDDPLLRATSLYAGMGDVLGEAKARFYRGMSWLGRATRSGAEPDPSTLKYAENMLQSTLQLYAPHTYRDIVWIMAKNGYAFVTYHQGETETAGKAYEQAAKVAEMQGAWEAYYVAKLGQAEMAIAKENWFAVIDILSFEEAPSLPAPSLCDLWLARAYLQIGDPFKALIHAQRAKDGGDRWRPRDEQLLAACKAVKEGKPMSALLPAENMYTAYLSTRSRAVLNR